LCLIAVDNITSSRESEAKSLPGAYEKCQLLKIIKRNGMKYALLFMLKKRFCQPLRPDGDKATAVFTRISHKHCGNLLVSISLQYFQQTRATFKILGNPAEETA
jgi:hypothetical protein